MKGVWTGALALIFILSSVGMYPVSTVAETRGKALFESHCSACHPNGGNVIRADMTLHRKDLERNGIRSPQDIVNRMRNPGPGMPVFDEGLISNEDAMEIARYILTTLSPPPSSPSSNASGIKDKGVPPSNGIPYIRGWQNWGVIAVSHRVDNKTLRLILGNSKAVEAARNEEVNPWPDGTVLCKVVWKDSTLRSWPKAIVPGRFVHVEFMLKDSKKYAKTYGWGWARWVGPNLEPFNKGPRVCISCHTPVKGQDWVFTRPAAFPGR